MRSNVGITFLLNKPRKRMLKSSLDKLGVAYKIDILYGLIFPTKKW